MGGPDRQVLLRLGEPWLLHPYPAGRRGGQVWVLRGPPPGLEHGSLHRDEDDRGDDVLVGCSRCDSRCLKISATCTNGMRYMHQHLAHAVTACAAADSGTNSSE